MEEAENPEQSKHNFSYWDRPSRTAVVKRRRNTNPYWLEIHNQIYYYAKLVYELPYNKGKIK